MKFNDSDFFYTASSISAFESCPLKFKYKYIEGFEWDDENDESDGRKMGAGREFHLAARRCFLGADCPAEFSDANVSKWISNLKESFQVPKDATILPECKLRLVRGNFRLEANIDLLVIREGRIDIWDWKTGAGKSAGAAARLKDSLQSMVYLVVAGKQLYEITGRNITDTEVVMSYWQPEPPGTIAEIRLEERLLEKYFISLTEKINRIRKYDWNSFDRNVFLERCSSCRYLPICNKKSV